MLAGGALAQGFVLRWGGGRGREESRGARAMKPKDKERAPEDWPGCGSRTCPASGLILVLQFAMVSLSAGKTGMSAAPRARG